MLGAQRGTSRRLLRWIAGLGALNAAALATLTLLSYGLAPVMLAHRELPADAENARTIARMIGPFGAAVEGVIVAGDPAATRRRFALAAGLPLAVSTGAFIALLVLLAREKERLDADVPARLRYWAVLFAALGTPALPALVQDFWLYVAWGRMVAIGANPYYVTLPAALAHDLPLDERRFTMTYGPLWAVFSGFATWIAPSLLSAAVVFKLVLASAWIGSVWLVDRLLRTEPVWCRCVGIAIVGWLPVSLVHGVAEGHNDVVVLFLLLVWLRALERGNRVSATAALTASALIKYVTAPLLVVDALYAVPRDHGVVAYLRRRLVVAAGAALAFALFFRGPGFFASPIAMAGWRFFTPADGILMTGKLLGGPAWPPSAVTAVFLVLGVGVLAIFPLLAAIHTVSVWRRPGSDGLYNATLAVLSAILFSGVGHVWPWFVFWVIGPAALRAGSAITRWVLGAALAVPFAMLALLLGSGPDRYVAPTILLSVAAFAGLVFLPRGWFPPAGGSHEHEA